MKNFIIKSYNLDFFLYFTFFLFLFLIIKYYKSLDKPYIKGFLIIIRSLSLLIVMLLLLNPIFNFTIEEFAQRELDLYVDNSKSIELNIKNNKASFKSLYHDINDWSIKNNVLLNHFLFNDSVSSVLDYDNIIYSKQTDFSNLFENINKNTFNGLNKEIVIVSDGVNNLGFSNYNNLTDYTIYTIGIGTLKNNYDIEINNINYSLADSSEITLDIKFDSDGINNELSKTIYLSNDKHISLPIGQATFFDDSYKNITLKIDKKHMSRTNIISINVDNSETNKENNSYLLQLDSNIMHDKKLLLISERLSPNTKSINHIINQIQNVKVDHIFKIDNSWNKSLNDINFNKYDCIIYDDVSLNVFNYVKNQNINNKKTIIFISDKEKIENVMVENNCKVLNQNILYTNDIKIEYMNHKILLPPIDYENIYKCNENSFTLNPFFYSFDSNKMVVNIENLYEYNALSIQNDIDNVLFAFIEKVIENEIYDRNKTIDIYTNKEIYIENMPINIFYNINDSLMINEKCFVEIYDSKGNILKINEFDLINNELLKFSFTPEISGYYNILGVIQYDNDKEVSNEIIVNVINNDIEISNIYLDEDYLTNIARNNNGSYVNIDSADEIFAKLNIDKIYNKKNINKDILSYQYLLIFLIFLLISEWYIRNKIGLP